jgi:hypothetical protein
MLGLALVASGVTAEAQPEACKADIEKFCSEVQQGRGRIVRCLNEHTDELSADCKGFMATRRKAAHEARRQQGRQRAGLRAACQADIEKFCKQAIGKPDQMAECLRTHQKELSDPCREKVEQVLKRLDERKAAEQKS